MSCPCGTRGYSATGCPCRWIQESLRSSHAPTCTGVNTMISYSHRMGPTQKHWPWDQQSNVHLNRAQQESTSPRKEALPGHGTSSEHIHNPKEGEDRAQGLTRSVFNLASWGLQIEIHWSSQRMKKAALLLLHICIWRLHISYISWIKLYSQEKETYTGVFELSASFPAIILAIFSRVIFLRGKESLSVAISAFAPRLMFLWRKKEKLSVNDYFKVCKRDFQTHWTHF